MISCFQQCSIMSGKSRQPQFDAAGHVDSHSKEKRAMKAAKCAGIPTLPSLLYTPACPIQRMVPFTMKMAFPTIISVNKIISFIFRVEIFVSNVRGL